MEVSMDERVSEEKVLCLLGRFEPLHLSLAAPRWPMGVLGAIVQISALSMFDTRKQTALSDPVASQLVSHDHSRHILQPGQQLSEKALGSIGIAPVLNEDVEHNAVLIHGTPEIVLRALDPDEHLAIARRNPTSARS